MRIIRPTTITPAMLTACNVPEDEYSAWSSGTSYSVGNKVIYSHQVYECLVAHTNAQPDLNITGTTPKWLLLGADNRWAMFDAKVGSQTSRAEEVTLTIAPGIVDSIAFLDVEATEIEVVMTDPVEGVVYSETLDMVMKSPVVDGYTYFFEPIITNDAAVLLGIPPYGSASIAITISNPGGTAKVGTVGVGMQKSIGMTQYNPSIGINDYSKKTADTFGNYSILERAYSKRMSCDLALQNTEIDDIHKTLAEYRATPVIWVGVDEGYSSMIIYGFYKSFSIVVPYPNDATCALEIEGLS